MDNNLSYYIKLVVYGFILSAFNTISIAHVDGYVNFIKVIANTIMFAVALWGLRKYFPIEEEFNPIKSFLYWTPFIIGCIGLMQVYDYRIHHHFHLNYLVINSILMCVAVIVFNNHRCIE